MLDAYRGSLGTKALLVAAPLFAQEFRAGITGIVRDVQSVAMPQANIEAINLETNEGVRLQFRAEVFNALNPPQLGLPSTSLGSTAAGSVTLSTSNDPRNRKLQ